MSFIEQIEFIKRYSEYKIRNQIFFIIYLMICALVQVLTNLSIMYLVNSAYYQEKNIHIVAIFFVIILIVNAILILFLKKKIINISFNSENNLINIITQTIFVKEINIVNTGTMHNVIMNRIKEYRLFLVNNLENIMYMPFVFIFNIMAMFILNYKIAAMILTCIIVTSFLNIYFSKKIIGYSKKFYELQNKFYGYQKELIDQYDWTILTDMRRVALKRYFKYSTDVQKSEEKVVKKNNETYVIALLNEYLPTILYMFIIVLNIDNENLSYGEVLALMSIVSTVSLPFTHTLRSFVALRKSVPFMEDMNGLLVKKEINNIQFLERKNNECLIDMENVTVMYDDKKVLQISNLKIFNGDKIAIIGETGSGKTTFFKLILGLLNFSEGKVIVYSDSKIDDLKSFWSKVSYLDNNTHIFNGSLYYNVTFNNDLSAKKSDEKYFDIINKLDLGKLEDRELYQHGKNLSGGQKMKICFARALYNDSEILLLDEPIASLDKESEQDIIELLKNMKKTILIITHRKNVLNICSRVLSVESGMINEK